MELYIEMVLYIAKLTTGVAVGVRRIHRLAYAKSTDHGINASLVAHALRSPRYGAKIIWI